MVFLSIDKFESTTRLDRDVGSKRNIGQELLVRLKVCEIRSLDTARGAGKAKIDYLVTEANYFKELGPPIGRNSGNTHFGKDFAQPLVEPFAIVFKGLVHADREIILFVELIKY